MVLIVTPHVGTSRALATKTPLSAGAVKSSSSLSAGFVEEAVDDETADATGAGCAVVVRDSAAGTVDAALAEGADRVSDAVAMSGCVRASGSALALVVDAAPKEAMLGVGTDAK